MNAIKTIIENASKLNGTIVLPEGMDARVVTAACACVDRKICKPIVLGTKEEIALAEASVGLSMAARGIKVIDYTQGDIKLEQEFLEAWNAKESKKPAEKQRLIDLASAQQTLRTKRIYFGGMLVKLGLADGLVAGSIASTGDMLRAAFHTLGTEKGVKTASSCFIMDLKEPTPAGDSVVAFGDCAVIPDPTSEQLADIAIATARTYRDLTGNEPRVAFLSFSTKGSAGGPLVEKVQKAYEIAAPKFAAAGIKVDGEMQFDAAIVPSVGQLKNPNGQIHGNANVFIFPDLQSGNIGYKIAQRLGGAEAIGPNLQGLAKAMNDLSRGCSAEDIVGTIAVTLLQSQSKKLS
ncbi:MAG: phosphate acetyltransferase [Kiritimatiellae bacterium]|nr:phosphate acetyltransferase [Kiritimatiellia bacterium]